MPKSQLNGRTIAAIKDANIIVLIVFVVIRPLAQLEGFLTVF